MDFNQIFQAIEKIFQDENLNQIFQAVNKREDPIYTLVRGENTCGQNSEDVEYLVKS